MPTSFYVVVGVEWLTVIVFAVFMLRDARRAEGRYETRTQEGETRERARVERDRSRGLHLARTVVPGGPADQARAVPAAARGAIGWRRRASSSR